MSITPEQLKIAVERYLAGEIVRNIAFSIDVPEPTLRAAIKRLGVSRPHLGHGPKRNLTPERAQLIVERYRAGEAAHAISKDLGIPVTTVRRTLTRYDVPFNPDLSRPSLSSEEKNVVAEACFNGMSGKSATKHFDISAPTVTRILRERGVVLPRKPRTCALNENAFDIITPTSAYWMGFLFADGAILHGDGSPSVAVNLGAKDREHVEKLRDFLGSSHKIREIPAATKGFHGGPAVGYRVRSKRLAIALEARGMIPSKPDRMPSNAILYSRDFWRGAVDGDGWLGTQNSRGNIYPHVGLSGQIQIMKSFQAFLNAHGLADLEYGPTESGIWRIGTSGSTAAAIIGVLYADAIESLTRKNLRAQAIIVGDIHSFPPYIEEPSTIVIAADDDDGNSNNGVL